MRQWGAQREWGQRELRQPHLVRERLLPAERETASRTRSSSGAAFTVNMTSSTLLMLSAKALTVPCQRTKYSSVSPFALRLQMSLSTA